MSAIRAKLGIGFTEGAAWFSIDEKEAAFARHKSPGHRAVILREWSDNQPLAWVFARSKSSDAGVDHAPHIHDDAEFPKCWLRDYGRIVLDLPLRVKKSVLSEQSYMCAEPDPEVTAAVLAAPVVP